MKTMSSIQTASIVGLVLGTVAPAIAQIDHRVNQGNTPAAGRTLDANSAVGSNGFNLTRPGLTDPGARANAIITGNVTGLGGFKGDSPIVAPNQFRASLPSAGLSGFQSRSVGINDVEAGRANRTAFFFDKTKTISDLGYIRAGLNEPGSSTIRTTNTPPPNTFTTDDTSAYLLHNIRQPQDLRVNISEPTLRPGITQTDISGGQLSKPYDDMGSSYQSAVGSSIFGSPPPREGSSPVSRGLPALDTPLDEEDDLQSRVARAVTDSPQDSRVDTQTPTLTDPAQETTLTPPTVEQTAANTGLVPPAVTPVNLGEDRFADLYNAVGVAQSMGVNNLGFDVAAELQSPGEQAAEPSDVAIEEAAEPAIFRVLPRRPSEGLTQLANAAQWASNVIDNPLQTFAGAHANKLNETMRRGEDELHKGRYYSASGYFELAAAIDPLNPLPLLARGHALAAAGDYRSAVRYLLRGIERFPQIAAFRIDLPAMIGKPDVFDIRRADLESTLARGENPELRFLLGYLELYSGLPEEGLKNLRLAAKASPPDSIVGIFADLVTGQRALPPLAK